MTVHLARKWRSKNFNELIGQELSVRLLKNSLFKKAFFPAYLFSGLRGSGKTSMGRIFAAAVNCHQLESFRTDPKNSIIPCGTCASCKALFAGQHPDFIEIDAASHTGVDNMRALIENASLLPILGTKKIYLIDEAHMLSKAAFNACLKILEEPPIHVIFILATTDPEKIIETIKSRCFQIFFDPIPAETLIVHLQHICTHEKIVYDIQGLTLLVQQGSGSARDALTTLERIVLAQGDITAQSVALALGLIKKEYIQQIVDLLSSGDAAQLLQFIEQEKILSYASELLWRALTDLIRTQLYDTKIIKDTHAYQQRLAWLKISYETEPVLAKSSVPHAVIEFMLLRMVSTLHASVEKVAAKPVIAKEPTEQKPLVKSTTSVPTATTENGQWQKFLALVEPTAVERSAQGPARPVPVQAKAAPANTAPAPTTPKSGAQSEELVKALKLFPGTIQEL